MSKILILDYNMGNTDSVMRAVQKCGGEPILSNSASELDSASHIILPGVGAFQKGMENINATGIRSKLEKQVLKYKVPFLGICLGMQLLGKKGFENDQNDGLGWIEGDVKKFEITEKNERIPHIGWNEVKFSAQNILFEGLESRTDFYFVHSYYFSCNNSSNVIATTSYCGEFVSAVRNNNIFGVQFHPEKSQKSGFALLKNFLLHA
jgi:imidazole glycerol-phosphate synthase subunit HisH